MKAQMGLEYVMVFVSSTAILVYVIATSLLTGAAGTVHGAGAYAPVQQSCYISPEFDCIGASASSTTGNVVVIFVNNAGATLKLPPQSYGVRIKSSLQEFMGSCTPSTAVENAKVTCTANVGVGTLKSGQQLTPAFTIGYEGCLYNSCVSELNITGTATLYST